LAEFIENGDFARHLRRMRTLYGTRRDALLDAVTTYLGDMLRIPKCEGGLDLPGLLPPSADDVAISLKARESGIVTRALSNFYLTPDAQKGLLLGFSAFSEDTLRQAVQQLAVVLERALR